MHSPCDARNLTPLSDSRHTKAEGKFTHQICRSRIFVPANERARVVPMYPSQSSMSHLHSLAQSMYIATFLPKHVITTCFADYVTASFRPPPPGLKFFAAILFFIQLCGTFVSGFCCSLVFEPYCLVRHLERPKQLNR